MRHTMLLIGVAVVLPAAGCPSTNPIECRDNTSCDLSAGGICTVAPSGNQWCAYPDPACPGGFRYSDFHTGDDVAGTCVMVGGDADAGVDAPVRTWSEPVALELNDPTQAESGASASPNGLELYFSAPQAQGSFLGDIFYVTRTGTSFAWGTSRMAVGGVNSAQQEGGAVVSADGLELYLGRAGSVFRSTRATVGAAWGVATTTGLVGSNPDVLADGRTMYYRGDAASCPVDLCLVKVTRAGAALPWGDPVVEQVNDGGSYQIADISGDGLRVLLSAPSRQGVAPVAVATRVNRTAPWSAPAPIAELAIYAGVISARWSWDEREMYLGFFTGANDIYVSQLR